ncbi:MAG: hypothetical protein VR72_09450 [Clostridiaceae bacterium BRH_c20a]|nr:MAG: hypothetical protein VR72_09450 [Clostridiaceae bacterium BRH_c20a]
MSVTNAFYIIINKFAQEVGMKEIFAQFIEIAISAGAILVIALLSCFFGFKLVRLCSGVTAFFLTAIAISVMLKPITHMGVIVITFAVVGLMAAFLVYQWYKFSVFLFNAMIGYSIAALFSESIWLCLAAAMILGAISLPFPPIVVILITTIWGGITLGFNGPNYIGLNILTYYKIIASSGLVAAGMFTQYSINRNLILSSIGRSGGRHYAKN